MRISALIALSVLGVVGAGCSSSSPAPAKAAATVTTVAAHPTFDAQAYCLDKLRDLAVKYPKSLGGSDLAAECQKMLSKTDATSAKTIDALLETAETYYKAIG